MANRVKFFKRFLIEFLEKLSKAFPEVIDEVNLKTIMTTLNPIVNDDLEANYNTNTNEKVLLDLMRKNSPTFKYMVQFYAHIEHLIEPISEENFAIFDDPKKFKTPKCMLVDIDIDFHKLWQSKNITELHKKTIFTYLNIMSECAINILSQCKVSNKNKKLILRNRIINQRVQQRIKQEIYKLIGEDGRNETIDKIIDEIIVDIQKNKHQIENGQLTPAKIQVLMTSMHKKMMAKYEQGEYDEKDLKLSFKSLLKNFLLNEDLNMKENFGQIMEIIKTMGNDELADMINENMSEEELRKKIKEIEEQLE